MGLEKGEWLGVVRRQKRVEAGASGVNSSWMHFRVEVIASYDYLEGVRRRWF